MNVSVVTSRKPKINETFAVNFGKPALIEFIEAGENLVVGSAKTVAAAAGAAAKALQENCGPTIGSVGEWLHSDASILTSQIRDAGTAALGYSGRKTQEFVTRAKDSVTAAHLSGIIKNTKEKLIRHITPEQTTVETLIDDLGLHLKRTQIASRLWWLKLRGQDTEHDRYEAKASAYLQKLELLLQEKKQESLSPASLLQQMRRGGSGKKTKCRGRGKGQWKQVC